MIEAEDLTKRYFDLTAVDRISFSVGKGEVVGFLGPNGAGKSTTLKILTCFIPATSGTARVAGFDVFRDSLKVRRQIGYLPENVPLYGDMRVREYLYFRGRLKGLSGREANARLDAVAETCGLADMKRRMVGQLSRGYRQRVGLADVLLHNPPILLLDEPTGGLDPNQRREVRDLIARLGSDHTLLLSSHILGEVESVCNRVLILKKGRIIADGKPADLLQKLEGAERIEVEARCPARRLEDALRSFPVRLGDIALEERDGETRALLSSDLDKEQRQQLLKHLVSREIPVTTFASRRCTLEEIFFRLTVEEEVLSGVRGRMGS